LESSENDFAGAWKVLRYVPFYMKKGRLYTAEQFLESYTAGMSVIFLFLLNSPKNIIIIVVMFSGVCLIAYRDL